jgi:adenine-specific DNA-methyltransferase
MASYDVFTPRSVAEKMRSYLPEKIGTLLEPSVGTGQLLDVMEGMYDIADVYDINETYLSKIPENLRIKKNRTDFLDAPTTSKYDAILMNPPYLRYQDMDIAQRSKVRNISCILQCGNIDLYVAFIVKSMMHLSATGTLVAIIPSTWKYNKSTEAFRKWLLTNRYIQEIHDYGSTKVFEGVDVYCCILVLTQMSKTHYTTNDGTISYDDVQTNTPGHVFKNVVTVTNGIATLCDSVYIHDVPLFDEPCWKPILKVSKQRIRSILSPYKQDGTIIDEDTFRKDNPQSYAYLQRNRDRLNNRDKGNKTYETWYAFGRKQGLKLPATKTSVYVSTLSSSDIPTSVHDTILFYSGLRLTSDTISTAEIQKCIRAHTSNINELCSKRSGGWINITSSVLQQVPILQSADQT